MRTPEFSEVIARWRADAATLERFKDCAADVLRRCADEAEASTASGWMRWLSDAEAMLRSGRKLPWLRARREELRQQGHARQVGRGKWLYRECFIPRRARIVNAAAAGRAAAREDLAAAS